MQSEFCVSRVVQENLDNACISLVLVHTCTQREHTSSSRPTVPQLVTAQISQTI
ncbi:Protein of unknown function [Pyronema omphalodes CBS 100304]|uniref:Uncharacterized protein n=1 Tax=Pyronema omphalodes (strain CBS 100304) TaxID=1076935 RepID=U4LD40_PYROM|nr:Protein of unknown function [Pyronema omphalodes CBS 100304]